MSENVTRPYCVIYLLLFPVWQHWRWAMRATIICLPLSNWLTCGFLIQRESMIKLHRSVKVNNMDTHVAVESNKKKCEQLKIAIYMPRNRICGRHNHPHKSIVCPTCIASRKQNKKWYHNMPCRFDRGSCHCIMPHEPIASLYDCPRLYTFLYHLHHNDEWTHPILAIHSTDSTNKMSSTTISLVETARIELQATAHAPNRCTYEIPHS